MNVKLILVSGWISSGKTEFVNTILEKSRNAHVYHFAKSLKDEVRDAYNLNNYCLYDSEEKNEILEQYPVQIHSLPIKENINQIKDLLVPSDTRVLVTSIEEIIHLTKKETILNKDENTRKYLLIDEDLYLHELSFGNTIKRLYWSPRALLIFTGTNRRSVQNNYFVIKTITEIKNDWFKSCFASHIECPVIILIDDWRFKNEEHILLQEFTKLEVTSNIELIRVKIDRYDVHPTNSMDPSEHDLDDQKFDVILKNRSTLVNFHNQIDLFYNNLYSI